MNKMRKTLLAVAIAALPVLPLQAAVIDHADVNGLRTFQDTNTGRVWLDLDNFFNMNTNDMVTAANAAGFTFATTADTHGLLDTLPLIGGEWAGYRIIMGGAPNRDIIWGSYDDGGDPGRIGWAYSNSPDLDWTFSDNVFPAADIPNGGSPSADMNIWAYQTGEVAVPEPGMLALLGIGLAGLGAARRRKS